MQKRHRFVHWTDLCAAMSERWGKSRHTFYMRQLLVLSQTGTVEEYTAKFNTLKHQILLEDPYTNEVLVVERYIAGLRANIRTAVILHRPEEVDTASLLATLQETEMETEKIHGYHRPGFKDKHKTSTATDCSMHGLFDAARQVLLSCALGSPKRQTEKLPHQKQSHKPYIEKRSRGEKASISL